MGIPQRLPDQDMRIFKERRDKLGRQHLGAAFLLPAKHEVIRNGLGVTFPFRQDSNFFYLTGFDEPDAVMLFRPGHSPEYVLFVRPKDANREVWDGFRYGPEGARHHFGADQAFTLDQLEQKVPELLQAVDRVYYPLRFDQKFDSKVVQLLEATRTSLGRTGRALLSVADPHGPLGELRIIKTEYEQNLMRKAAQLTVRAHQEVMKACRPGRNERYLQGVFLGEILKQGAAREGYGSILAGGANSTCLHYTANDQDLKGGDLFLIDAGGEYNFYTADITRTYPVSGKFSPVQARFYQRVLDVQKQIIAMVEPGLPYAQLQTRTTELLTDAMIEFGLLQGTREQAIESMAYRQYYPHGVSHFLGMDVHDIGLYVSDGQSRPLEPGMVLTVEPGLYVPYDDEKAPAELRGLGVRIEDDVLVTPNGNEVLTAGLAKEIIDLEQWVGRG